jgi:hypothetical protein
VSPTTGQLIFCSSAPKVSPGVVFGREHRRGPGHGAAAEFTAEIQRHRNGHHGVEDGAVDLLPVRTGKKGTPFRDARQMAEGIIYRVSVRDRLARRARGVRALADDLDLASADAR